MKYIFILALFLLMASPAMATTYYVDNCVIAGNDSNNGTTTAAPWLTIAKVNAHTFNAGDSVLFEKTCAWREELAPPSSGSAGNPITFGAYGRGALPIINGSDLLSGWSTGRIYSYDAGASSAAKLSITYNQTIANIYAIPLTAASGPLYFDGIKVVHPVPSLNALNGDDQWYFDSVARILYIYSLTNPSHRTIEAAASSPRDYGVIVSSKKYVTLTNLSVQKARFFGVEIATADHVAVTNVESALHGSSGIDVERGSSNITISGGSSHDNGGRTGADSNGIGTGGLGATSTPITISGVEVYNNVNSDIEMYGPSGGTAVITVQNNHIHGGSSAGIRVDGPGAQTITILGNLVVGTADHGIVGIGTASPAVFIYNNTIAANAHAGLFALAGTWTVANNLFYNNNTGGLYFEMGDDATVAGWTSNYNDIYHAAGGKFMFWHGILLDFADWLTTSGQDAHSLISDPVVTNAGANNFTLQWTSPLKDAGVNLGSTHQNALLPGSVWPNGVVTGNQNSYGTGWEIGAYILP